MKWYWSSRGGDNMWRQNSSGNRGKGSSMERYWSSRDRNGTGAVRRGQQEEVQQLRKGQQEKVLVPLTSR
jgi:hypothetical protein